MTPSRNSTMKPMRSIALLSPKGGSGKTVLAATFASFLHEVGFKVLVVDTDSATNGMTLFFIKEVVAFADLDSQMQARGMYDNYRQDSSEFQDSPLTPFATSQGFDFLPASFHLQKETRPWEEVLLNSLQEMRRISVDYDFVLLDAQAGSEAHPALVSSPEFADDVLIVSEFDPMSIAGIDRLKASDPSLTDRTWVLLNKVLPEFADDFGSIMEMFRYLPPIPWDADVVRSYARRRLALDYEQGNAFTLAVLRTVQALFGSLVEDKISEWVTARRSLLLKPILAQFNDTKWELETLLEDSERKKRKRLMKQTKSTMFYAAIVSFILATIVGAVLLSGMYKSSELVMSITIAVVAPLFIVLIIQVYRVLRGGVRLTVEETVAQSMTEHRIASLRERLDKLGALKDSDIDTLMSRK